MSLLALLLIASSVPASAQAPSSAPARCSERANVRYPQAMSGATLVPVGNDLLAVPQWGDRVFRSRGCSGRFRAIAMPHPLVDPKIVPVGDDAVVLVPTPPQRHPPAPATHPMVYRRGRARPLSRAIAPHPETATFGSEMFFLERAAGGGAGIVETRTGRVRELPPHPQLTPRLYTRVTMDAERIFVIGGGEADLVFDRRAGTWGAIESPPDLIHFHLLETPSGVVLLGSDRGSGRSLEAHVYDVASNAWRPLPFPSGRATRAAVARTWRHRGSVVLELTHASNRTALILDPATLTWQTVQGSVRGGRGADSGPIYVGVQAPRPRPGVYPAATVDPDQLRWRYATIPEVPRNAKTAWLRGRLVIVERWESRPGGWTPVGCEGPRPPGTSCDQMMAPTTSSTVPGRVSVVPLRWR